MNNNRPDLNLLVVFDAVARTGSVTRAATALALSQPAVSHALNRLRRRIGDPLFVRSSAGLAPTPHAVSLRGMAAAIIDQARTALAAAHFDPATTTRTFRIGVSEYAALTVAPGLAAALLRAAPSARLELAPVGEGTLDAVRSGDLDVTFWGADPPAAPFESIELYREHFVVLAARAHGLAGRAGIDGAIAIGDYLDFPHARVSIAGANASPIDDALAALGLERRVAVTAPGFASLLALLDDSSLIASVPSRLANSPFGRRYAQYAMPLDTAPFGYRLVWHRRHSADVGHRWLRSLVARAIA